MAGGATDWSFKAVEWIYAHDAAAASTVSEALTDHAAVWLTARSR